MHRFSDVDDTIVALASSRGGGMRGIIRLSGPRVVECLERCFRSSEGQPLRQLRRASVLPGALRLAAPLSELECELYLWPGRRSYTRQPCAELHTIGSPPLLDAAIRSVCAAGARLAEPGEFTFRAFLAGRLDLTQAEAVMAVVDARDRRELRAALEQLAGGLATPLGRLRNDLLDLLSSLEAALDFADEEIEFVGHADLVSRLSVAAGQVEQLESQLAARVEPEGLPRVVLLGWPNVGKSSLFNALAGGEPAIVSHLAGTTRDYLCQRVAMDGMEVLLVDTAGVETGETAQCELWTATQQAATGQRRRADLALFCLDATRPLSDRERSELAEGDAARRLIVFTKVDAAASMESTCPGVATSSRTGEGLGLLRKAIRSEIERAASGEDATWAATATRCRENLRCTGEHLKHALDLARNLRGEELVAAEIRAAIDELGRIVGAVYTEDLLDRIFSRFCLGK